LTSLATVSFEVSSLLRVLSYIACVNSFCSESRAYWWVHYYAFVMLRITFRFSCSL